MSKVERFSEVWPDEWKQISEDRKLFSMTEEECLHRAMMLEDDEVESENDPMHAVEEQTDQFDGPVAKSKKRRNPKRVGPDGKPMRRLVLVFTSDDYDRVVRSISIRFSPLFAKVYGGAKISMEGPTEESYARAISEICNQWQAQIED